MGFNSEFKGLIRVFVLQIKKFRGFEAWEQRRPVYGTRVFTEHRGGSAAML